jgi:hypothetical protein
MPSTYSSMYVFFNNMAEILGTEQKMNAKRHIIALFHAREFRARTPSKSSIYHYVNENSILGTRAPIAPLSQVRAKSTAAHEQTSVAY